MFRPIDQENRFAAMDAVEAVANGRPATTVPRETGAAIGMLLERGASQTEAIAATSISLQEKWAAKYRGANAAMMMAGVVAATRHALAGDDLEPRTPNDEAQASGAFHLMDAERQERIASAINQGVMMSARERLDVAERYETALKADAAPTSTVDQHEATRRSIDAARAELSIGPREWHGAGDRGGVSFLLHVQAPAMLAAVGAEYRCDPSNEQYVVQEAERMRQIGLGAPATVHGVQHNMHLAREMTGWLAPTLSDAAISATAIDGPLAGLASQIERQTAMRGQNQAVNHALAAGAIAR